MSGDPFLIGDIMATIKNLKNPFTRARSDLVSEGILQVEDDYYSLGDKATFGDKR